MDADQMARMISDAFGVQAETLGDEPTHGLIALARESLEVIEAAECKLLSVSRAYDHAGRLMGIAVILAARCAAVEDRMLRDAGGHADD
jgi:hypothetical protein